MRRWVGVTLGLLVVAGCSGGAPEAVAPAATAQQQTRLAATPRGPTPALPMARAVAATPTSAVATRLGVAMASTPLSAMSTPQSSAPLRQSTAFVLHSTAFVVGGAYPADYTCDGGNQSPPLAWSGAPPGTSAFALIEQDADARSANEPFTHWLLYNMPPGVTSLAAAVPARPLLSNGSQQGQNSHLTIGYFGPCPRQGDPPHHYSFELLAQDGSVALETGASIDEVRLALAGHILGQTQLLATLQR